MRKLIIGLTAGALLAAGTALAVKPGDHLYIKTKDAKLLAKPDAKAKQVGSSTMKPGEEVTWNGADKTNKMFHEIARTDGSKGFTLQQNLSPNKPAVEVVSSDGKTIDAEALKSSGAATKALSEAALKYGEGETDMLTLTKGIMTAEGIAAKVEASEAAEHLQKATGGGK